MTKSQMPRLEPMPLAQLIAMAHKKNPKSHDIPALIASFDRFGFKAFPTIDENTQVMVAGHGRCEGLAAMKTAGREPPDGIELRADGEWMVPVVRGVSFVDERQRDAYVITDNQQTIHGGWNIDLLAEMVNDLRLDGFDGMGFSAPELDSLLGQYEPPSKDAAADAAAADDPSKFVKHDIKVDTTYCCPKCGYEWSGKPK